MVSLKGILTSGRTCLNRYRRRSSLRPAGGMTRGMFFSVHFKQWRLTDDKLCFCCAYCRLPHVHCSRIGRFKAEVVVAVDGWDLLKICRPRTLSKRAIPTDRTERERWRSRNVLLHLQCGRPYPCLPAGTSV